MAKRVGIDKDAVVRAAAKIADDHGWDALTLARVAMVVGKRWNSLSSKERARLAQLVGESRGRVGKG